MNNAQWFRKQLATTADGFLWAVQQVPAERQNLVPPTGLGEWSAARHLFHMLYYEQTIALPSMRQWLNQPGLAQEDLEQLDEDAAWDDGHEIRDMQRQFREVRAAQIVLLSDLSDEAWREEREAVWGLVTLHWVVSKTYQHTAEHTDDVLKIALFWDAAAAYEAQQAR
jgi:hypothetical protein